VRRGILTLLAMVGLAVAAVPGEGQAPPPDAVYLCNEVVLRIRVPAGGLTVDQRREEVRLRIVRAYANEEVTAPNIRLSHLDSGWVIMVGRTALVTVTEADGRANASTAAALAQAWTARLRHLLPRCLPQPLLPGR